MPSSKHEQKARRTAREKKRLAKAAMCNAERIVQDVISCVIMPLLETKRGYGDAFLSRRITYFTDRISSKAHRIQNTEDLLLDDVPQAGEGIRDQLMDIIVYGCFALEALDNMGPQPENPTDPTFLDWVHTYFKSRKGD